ncbi:MAG: hypothetical protein IKS97_01535, partial [Fibrobacter sp.]|nr:hypothetical protein [Fibrobacter sp.]
MFRKLLLALLLLSLSALGANFPNVSNTDLVNPVPQGVVPLFSIPQAALLETPYDSVNIGYTATNTTFADTLEIDALNKPKEVSPLLVIGEVLGFNGLIWAWDRYVLDKDYARTGPSYWKRNFQEGWEWDHNHWA